MEVELSMQEVNGFLFDCWFSKHAQANGGS